MLYGTKALKTEKVQHNWNKIMGLGTTIDHCIHSAS